MFALSFFYGIGGDTRFGSLVLRVQSAHHRGRARESMTAQESQNTGAENSTDKEATPQELADHGGYDSMSDIANDKLAWQAWDWINENRDIRFVPDGGGEFYSYTLRPDSVNAFLSA